MGGNKNNENSNNNFLNGNEKERLIQVKSILQYEFKSLCTLGFMLPLCSFLLCILMSIVKDFESANRTHCGVSNIFPSISASISHFYPQNTIWRLCIGIDSFPRYLIAVIYYKKYYLPKTETIKNKKFYKTLIKTAFIFHHIELTALLLLTYVSSVDIFFVHMLSFLLFLSCSFFYMILTIYTYSLPRQPRTDSIENSKCKIGLSIRETNSKKYKKLVFISYLFCLVTSLYFYYRHNVYCEPYVYSLFSLFEYVIVLLNIGYHSLIFYDMDLVGSSYKVSLIEPKLD